MKFGFVLPTGDARSAASLAELAEQSGWDGFFVWEPVWGIDAWVSLTAAAMLTRRIRLGTMLSPISRMRPWKLASETATLDQLSGGRVILSVGLGAVETGFLAFGEQTDRKIRAELVDEGLDILTGLWKGQPFAYDGKHYTLRPTDFELPPPPIQQPRIPIWVVGVWPREKSMQRVLRYDGLLPSAIGADGHIGQASLEQIREMKAYLQAHRIQDTPFDIVVEGNTPGEDPAGDVARVQSWEEAGATWWIESLWDLRGEEGLKKLAERLRRGPPR